MFTSRWMGINHKPYSCVFHSVSTSRAPQHWIVVCERQLYYPRECKLSSFHSAGTVSAETNVFPCHFTLPKHHSNRQDVFNMSVCTHSCACMCARTHWEPEVSMRCPPQSLSTWFLRLSSDQARLSGQQAPGILCLPSSGTISIYCHAQCFHVDAGDWNSANNACLPSNLLTEPSSQAPKMIFTQNQLPLQKNPNFSKPQSTTNMYLEQKLLFIIYQNCMMPKSPNLQDWLSGCHIFVYLARLTWILKANSQQTHTGGSDKKIKVKLYILPELILF